MSRMTPAARAIWRRRLFSKKKFGANVGGESSNLPLVLDFDAMDLGAMPTGYTQEAFWGQPTIANSATAMTIVAQPQGTTTGAGAPGSKCLKMPGDHTSGIGSNMTYDLGETMDFSAGFRMMFYVLHDHVSGNQDNHIIMAPSLTSDKVNNFQRFHLDNSSNNAARLQLNLATTTVINDSETAIVDGDKWNCVQLEMNLSLGTGYYKSWYWGGVSWISTANTSHSFTTQDGIDDVRYVCFGNYGSTSTWAVYDDAYISQFWLGTLSDSFPTVGDSLSA